MSKLPAVQHRFTRLYDGDAALLPRLLHPHLPRLEGPGMPLRLRSKTLARGNSKHPPPALHYCTAANLQKSEPDRGMGGTSQHTGGFYRASG